ncbi:MAG: hypothetical protein ACR2N3_05055 [Pyrinomonadaceae bacterium]
MAKNLSPKISGLTSVLLVASLILLGGCQSSKELSRSSAQSLIEANADFNQPLTIDLQEHVPRTSAQPIQVASANETPEQAIRRDYEQQEKYFPAFALAAQLGLVKAAGTTEEKTPPPAGMSIENLNWHVNEQYKITEQGIALWKAYDLPPIETEIPIAKREFVEITGITKINDQQEVVDYKYKNVPNEIGKYIDYSTTEFKSLPEDLQRRVRDGVPPTKGIQADWGRIGTARAYFRRYDDGWRIERAF